MAGRPTEPRVVLVGGPPASGKTTLAGRLARELGLPLIAKDGLKETLFDAVDGDVDLRRSQTLGRAAFALLWHVLDCQLAAGASAVGEGSFDRVRSVAALDRLRERHAFAVVQVHCRAPVDVLERRYAGRAAERHPGHLDAERHPRLESDAYLLDLPYAELVVVDTTATPEDVYGAVARALGPRLRS
jgi:predicted kinase